MMMKRLLTTCIGCCLMIVFANGQPKTSAVNLAQATIVYHEGDAPLVKQMAQVLADDIGRVSGTRPGISTRKVSGAVIAIGTVVKTGRHRELRGAWERYAIDTRDGNVVITGSDARGLAYGVLHVSEAIGVSPWYWFADIPIDKTNKHVYEYAENYVSPSPSVKYRGIFINDEDWGLKTWAAQTFEKELGDIGPKTYDRVCELILRLKGNMLAPAMHSCTGAFYSHPESQKMADKWGIMITTSHCEPLLFNNAAPSEWDKARDGEWNYETNSATILKKLDDRIRETAQYENIYTMGMRGLHDEAMKGSTDPKDRARTLEKVFAKQSKDACCEIDKLIERYNTQLDGKWNQMISEVPPGYTALYHQMPTYTDTPTDAYRLPDSQRHPEFCHQIDLASLAISEPFRLLDGIGTDWKALQMGQPLDLQITGSIDIPIPVLPKNADSVSLCISVVPMWPVATDRSNRFSVSVDHGKAEVCENLFKEWGREWKIQVLENRKEFVLTLPLDTTRNDHVMTLSIVDPGQIIQKITYQ